MDRKVIKELLNENTLQDIPLIYIIRVIMEIDKILWKLKNLEN